MLFVHEGTGVCDTIFGPIRYGPGRLPRPADRDDLAARARRGLGAADALPRGAVGDRAAEALPERLRPAPRARALLAARPPRRPTRSGPATSQASSSSTSDRPTGSPPTTTRHHPFDVVGWDGYLWPFRFNIGDFQPITGPGPPAAAGPPDVPGAELRRVLVRAAQVRLPPACDPGAVQPLEHQQRRGHLLRRRQLHEPARRGDRVVHAPSGRDPARAAPGHGRGVDRQGARPKSWRSWSTRSIR